MGHRIMQLDFRKGVSTLDVIAEISTYEITDWPADAMLDTDLVSRGDVGWAAVPAGASQASGCRPMGISRPAPHNHPTASACGDPDATWAGSTRPRPTRRAPSPMTVAHRSDATEYTSTTGLLVASPRGRIWAGVACKAWPTRRRGPALCAGEDSSAVAGYLGGGEGAWPAASS